MGPDTDLVFVVSDEAVERAEQELREWIHAKIKEAGPPPPDLDFRELLTWCKERSGLGWEDLFALVPADADGERTPGRTRFWQILRHPHGVNVCPLVPTLAGIVGMTGLPLERWTEAAGISARRNRDDLLRRQSPPEHVEAYTVDAFFELVGRHVMAAGATLAAAADTQARVVAAVAQQVAGGEWTPRQDAALRELVGDEVADLLRSGVSGVRRG